MKVEHAPGYIERKTMPRQKTAFVSISLTPAQKAMLKRLSQREFMSLSAWIMKEIHKFHGMPSKADMKAE